MSTVLKNKQTYLFTLVIIALLLAGLEWVGQRQLAKNPGAQKLRQFLLGSTNTDHKPILTGHPYLNYICTPEYSDHGIQRHNRYGYRGDTVAFEKPPGTYRILFLGGSTTYNVNIYHEDSTLSEQLKSMLGADLAGLPGAPKIEVMNGGIFWGTSFEILSHYLYKFRYYRPDLIVVHTGGNDAQAYTFGHPYQADYNNWRTSFGNVEPARGINRLLLKPRWLAYILIRSKYDRYLNGSHYVHNGEKLITPWFKPVDYLENPDHNAFYNNIRNLILSANADGAKVLLVPFVVNKDFEYNTPEYLNGIERNISFMKQLSIEYNVPFCNVTPEDITKEFFYDDCHLNGRGVRQKAEAMLPCIESLMGYGTVVESDVSR